MKVKLFDCSVTEEGQKAAVRVLSSGQIASGSSITELEEIFQSMFLNRYAISTSNVTSALEIALTVAGVGRGDEVLTLAFNCLVSNAAIHNIGASPVWVDTDPISATMNVEDAKKLITSKTKALIVYYVAGYPADVTSLRDICDEYGLILIEDANASFGAVLPGGGLVGSVGNYAVFSLYANRLLNGLEGAILLCDDFEKAGDAKCLRKLGINQANFRDTHGEINPLSNITTIGKNAYLNNLNAAIALEAMKNFNYRLEKIRQNAEEMYKGLKNTKQINAIVPLTDSKPAYWLFLILTERQLELMAYLRKLGIGCTKLHQSNKNYSGFKATPRALEGTEILSSTMVGLPIGWWLDQNQIDYVIDALLAF